VNLFPVVLLLVGVGSQKLINVAIVEFNIKLDGILFPQIGARDGCPFMTVTE
jgi:hypothetical protein